MSEAVENAEDSFGRGVRLLILGKEICGKLKELWVASRD